MRFSAALMVLLLLSGCAGQPHWAVADTSPESTHLPFRWAITQCVGAHDPDRLEMVIANKPYDPGSKSATRSRAQRAVVSCMSDQGWAWSSGMIGF